MRHCGTVLIRLLIILALSLQAWAQENGPKPPVATPVSAAQDDPASILAPLKTESPRDTMQSYVRSMSRYLDEKRKGSRLTDSHLRDAVRTFDTSGLPALQQAEAACEAAILLKEVLDRVILLEYDLIPDEKSDYVVSNSRWRLKGTEIVISRMPDGERKDEWLFSAQTVARAAEFFEKVRHLPYQKGTGGGADYQDPWQDSLFPMPDWLKKGMMGLLTWQWIAVLIAIFLGYTMRSVFAGLGSMVIKLTHKTPTEWDDKLVQAMISPGALLAATGIWMLSARVIGIRGQALTIINVLLQLLLSFGLIWVFYRVVGVLTEYIRVRAGKSKSQLDDQIVKLISSSLKTFIVVFGVLLAAQNLGIEIFSVLAGLGIGGLAVALAAKDTLANFFGSIMIMIDKPFAVGHWVVISGMEGTVEEIGFRTTRIRTFYDSVISVPNSNIATAGVDNLGLRHHRRVRTNIDITYNTSPEKMERFLEGIRELIRSHPHTRKENCHVVFNDFADSSLRIMLYFFLTVPDWKTELIYRNDILLDIVRLADRIGVQFAFPTRTLHIEPPLPALKAPERSAERKE